MRRKSETKNKNQKILKIEEEEEEDIYDESTIIKPFPDQKEYKLVKKSPNYQIKENDIYVGKNSKQIPQIKRIQTLLQENNAKIINVYGLGNSISKACDLVLKMKEIFGEKLNVGIKTGTVELIDEFIPLKKELLPLTQCRYNSSIHFSLSLNKPK